MKIEEVAEEKVIFGNNYSEYAVGENHANSPPYSPALFLENLSATMSSVQGFLVSYRTKKAQNVEIIKKRELFAKLMALAMERKAKKEKGAVEEPKGILMKFCLRESESA